MVRFVDIIECLRIASMRQCSLLSIARCPKSSQRLLGCHIIPRRHRSNLRSREEESHKDIVDDASGPKWEPRYLLNRKAPHGRTQMPSYHSQHPDLTFAQLFEEWHRDYDISSKAAEVGLTGKSLNRVIKDFQPHAERQLRTQQKPTATTNNDNTENDSNITVSPRDNHHNSNEAPLKFKAELRAKLYTRLDDLWVTFLHKYVPKDQTGMFNALCEISDLRFPREWHPLARAMRRKIIMHVGPTNSGKTYNALQAFQVSEKAIYCGPLRLLAHEVFDRTNQAGMKCNLVTGEERKFIAPGVGLMSCTIEMADLSRRFDVAILDEIQMLADPQRGWAWTQALLGIQAREVHLCGEESAVPVVKKICESLNEVLEIKTYTRLSALSTEKESLKSDLLNVRKGDCIIAFSRTDVFMYKREVERRTGMKCAIVYGALPPETRSEQARLFNDPDSGYDVLVATDAVGMGLNLSIGRVVFSTLNKFDGTTSRELSVSAIKQIGGRAGRFNRTKQTEGGTVTCLHENDMKILRAAMSNQTPPINSAGLQPTLDILETFSAQLPGERMSGLLGKFEALARVDSDAYFLCNLEEQKRMADMIENLSMTIRDRYIFLMAPINIRDPLAADVFRILALKFAQGKSMPLLRLISKSRILSTALVPMLMERGLIEKGKIFRKVTTSAQLATLEALHRIVMSYLWLRQRFSTHKTFLETTNEEAELIKRDCEETIVNALRKTSEQQTSTHSRKESPLEPFKETEITTKV